MANPYNLSLDSQLWKLPEGYNLDLITTVRQPLPVGSENLGLTSTEGEAFSQTITTEAIKAHQRDKTLRNIVTDSKRSMNLTLTEDRKAVRELFHGAKENADGMMDITGEEVIEANFVYDSTDDGEGYEKDIRLVFRATVTPNGDITFARGTLIAYPIMLDAIGKVRRISTPDGATTPTNPTDPPVDPNPTTYPSITNITTAYIPESETLSVQWDVPSLGMDDFVSGYQVSLIPMDAGSGANANPSGPSADLSPVAVGNYQLTVSYGVNGLPTQHGATTIPVTVAV